MSIGPIRITIQGKLKYRESELSAVVWHMASASGAAVTRPWFRGYGDGIHARSNHLNISPIPEYHRQGTCLMKTATLFPPHTGSAFGRGMMMNVIFTHCRNPLENGKVPKIPSAVKWLRKGRSYWKILCQKQSLFRLSYLLQQDCRSKGRKI